MNIVELTLLGIIFVTALVALVILWICKYKKQKIDQQFLDFCLKCVKISVVLVLISGVLMSIRLYII